MYSGQIAKWKFLYEFQNEHDGNRIEQPYIYLNLDNLSYQQQNTIKLHKRWPFIYQSNTIRAGKWVTDSIWDNPSQTLSQLHQGGS